MMSDFDVLALAEARDILLKTADIEVLGDWRQLSSSAVWMLKLRLALRGAEPTTAVPALTEWEVVANFEKDPWGKVQMHPALGEHGISHSFSHQRFNGGSHPTWPCRNGHICAPSWLSQIAKQRGAVQEEPVTTIERICWNVDRTLQWLTAAAADELVHTGDVYELPDFEDIAPNVLHALAYFENHDSYQLWQQQPRSGIAYLASFAKMYMTHHFKDADDRQVVYQPAWGKLISAASPSKFTQALWIRLDEVPVVNTYQVPVTVGELRQALNKEGKDLDELLKPLWSKYQLGKEASAFLLVGMPVSKRVGEPPHRYHWQMVQLIQPAALKFPKMNKEILKKKLAEPQSRLRWLVRVENWHPEDLQNRGRLTLALREANVLLLGAGALGSQLANQLVRMGVQRMTLVDGDTLEAGNLVRHDLTLDELQYAKTDVLAQRLNMVQPSVWITSIPENLPTTNSKFAKAAAEATLIIDATASDDVLRLMPLPGMNPDAIFVTCSLSLYAEHLFFYATRTVDFEQSHFNAWFEQYRVEQEKQVRQLELPRDAGCWSAHTPAPLNRIVGLAGAAVELLEQVYEQPVDLPVSLSYTWQRPTLVRATEEVFT